VRGRRGGRHPLSGYLELYHLADFDESGYDGVLEPGMTICVESYVGEGRGEEGVKLEQQALIGADGIELLSSFPFEQALL
jgi:Xaa-Pro aminopeptidase